MNLAIEKALINKNIDYPDHNPKIVINGSVKGIQKKVKEILKKSSRIDIAVSYAVWSGLSLIHKDLQKFDSKSKIIVTTEGMVTDIKSLRALKQLPISSKVYDPEYGDMGFHLKSYFGENMEEKTLLIGSSNISSRAFGLVHEMGVEIKSKGEGQIISEYRDTFDAIWNDKSSKPITDIFIDEYKEKFNNKKEMLKKLCDFKLETEITPNYMQRKALEKLKECRKQFDRGLVVAATGTGKTYLSAFDVKDSGAKKVLFLVHNRLILTDAIKTFKKIFKDKIILELKTDSTTKQILNADFIFTTDKTAKSIFCENSKYKECFFDYIIYDEAHKIGEETIYRNLIEWFKPKFSLGITATPERSDNPKYLFEVFKYNVPYEIRLLDAMEHELVCPFTYYGYNLDEKLLKAKEKFDIEKLAPYLKNIIKDKGHYGEKLKGIVFCKDVDEAESLSNEFNKLNVISFCASGQKIDREKIENAILDLKSDEEKSTELICVVDRFNEGIDIPGINTIIMLRNTTSSIIYLQQLGRGLRRTEDPHKYVTVFDIIGNSKNNYSIAEVLTGNTTVDKRKLFQYANSEFKNVSPFINVEIEKEAMDKIIKSISKEFKVENRLKQKFKDELYRFKEIPTLLNLYTNPNFKEIELIQLLSKNFYDVFIEEYVEKYEIAKDSTFLSKFFRFITQFIFRAYDKETLSYYTKLLKGEK
ncbi:MAG: DEAD/DEAH box helicase family protein, partial [Fusobacteriaceae bacterium]